MNSSEDLLKAIAGFLVASKSTIATCESCTGGMMGAMLTHLPGSSSYYRGGLITYATDLKERVLCIPATTVASCGVVSEEIARMMAFRTADLLEADYAVATSGVAGPDGGTKATPVGTIWCGYRGPHGSATRLLRLGGAREEIRALAVQQALHQFLALATQHLI